MNKNSGLDPHEVFQLLKDGHRRFLNGNSTHPHSSLARLHQLAAGQHPMAAVLGCADSRVPLELLFDAGFGDLFVVRSAGNTVFTAAIGSLEYAIAHLDVNLILVLGHERCGAVSAALNFAKTLPPALGQVVGQVRMQLIAAEILKENNQQSDQAAKDLLLDRACRANAVQSGRNLVASSVLLTDRVRAGSLVVETGHYDLDTGEIDWLGSVAAQ
jgi:carbonic anhydrase